MLKDFLSFFQQLLTVAKENERLRKDIERLERTQVEHGLLLQRLADQIIRHVAMASIITTHCFT